MTWGVSASDVLNTTGVSATVAQVNMADAMVTVFINRTPDASASMGARDLFWIRSGIQWQAAWIPTQPDLTSRNQVENISQDGLSISREARWATVLAPMAARALRNLTWKGSRTLRTPDVSVPTTMSADITMETSDWWLEWDRL